MDFFVAIALFLQTSGQVADPQPQRQHNAAAGANNASPVDTDASPRTGQAPINSVLICRERRRAGTRVAHTECYSRSHADRTADVAQETMRLMLENSGHNN